MQKGYLLKMLCWANVVHPTEEMPKVRLVQAFIYIRKHDGDNQYARPVPFVPIYNPAEKKVGLLNKCPASCSIALLTCVYHLACWCLRAAGYVGPCSMRIFWFGSS